MPLARVVGTRFSVRSCLLILGSAASAATAGTPDLNRQIVNLYSARRCSEIAPLVAHERLQEMRPSIIAVIASCGLPGQDPEVLFKMAEEKDPHNDLVAVLHAIHVNRSNPAAAKVYWTRALMYARSESLRDRAREALSGLPVRDVPLNLSSWTWTVEAQLGASEHSSAWFQEDPQLQAASSAAIDANLFLHAQHWIRNGSISATYQLEDHQFLQDSGISTQTHSLAVPYALRVGESEDLVFRPFFQEEWVGGKVFTNAEGLGFTGVAYRGLSRQTVSGFAAAEQTLFPNVQTPNQAHYHFDYQWEWFPSRWHLWMKASIDDYSAAQISQIGNVLGAFNESHNDLFLAFTVRRGFDQFSLGVTSNVGARFDTHDSTYVESSTQQVVNKTREDYFYEVEPHFLWRVLPQLELKAYLRQTWVASNITAQDYGIDRSHDDTVVGVQIRTYWSSY